MPILYIFERHISVVPNKGGGDEVEAGDKVRADPEGVLQEGGLRPG